MSAAISLRMYWSENCPSLSVSAGSERSPSNTSAIERGPGRHGVSNAFFVYLRDPDGHRVELYTGDYYTGDPDHRPIRWSASDPRRRTFWGHHVPDSWYEEGSLVRAPDGKTEYMVPALRKCVRSVDVERKTMTVAREWVV